MGEIIVPFVDLKAQYATIKPEIDEAMAAVVNKCDFILGGAVAKFEEQFANFLRVKHCITVGSGLDALKMALWATGIARDDEVILPANTFIATALAVSEMGAVPVLVDCNRETYEIDVKQIEEKITKKTTTIIPVHLTGQSVDMTPLLEITDYYDFEVIEDACQAHGTTYKNLCCGTFGDVGCFSFYPGKNLGAYGDGGAIVTNNDLLASKLRDYRNYGQVEKNKHIFKGTNSRLDTLQAAVLLVKLKYLSQWNLLRAAAAEAYKQGLEGVGDLKFQQITSGSSHIYHLFIVETGYRDELKSFLTERGIQVGIHYPIPIHKQVAYAIDCHVGSFPNAEYLADRMLSLPMYPEIGSDNLGYVIDTVRKFFAK